MSLDILNVEDLDNLTMLDTLPFPAPGASSMGWSTRGGNAVADDATDRFLMRLAVTALNFEEMDMRNTLPFPRKARESLRLLACYLNDIGYLSDEALVRIEENIAAHERNAYPQDALEIDGETVKL